MSEVTNINLSENEYVQRLLEIMKKNGLDADAKGLAEVVGHVVAVQSEISKAVGEVNAMRGELAAMREEQSHPVKTMLHNAADGLIKRLNAVQRCLASLKNKIIDACKRAVEAFKDQGVAALNGAVAFLDIKHDLALTRDAINSAVEYKQGQIAKIEEASAEMHSAGRSLKNIGRIMRGKEPVTDIKPNGKLARLAEAPFRFEVQRLNRSLGRVNKALSAIDRIEKAAALRAERARPSTLGAIKEGKTKIAEQNRNAPVKVKTAAEEL
jgi:hypothetical protein